MIPNFKAWDKFDKEMLDVHGINYDAKGVWTKEVFDDEDNGDFIHFSDIELMQSTGLFDKNGTEIYEGDIVIETSYLIENYELNNKVVEWSEWTCQFNISVAFEYEVIGNKFEHPHLLEED